MSTPLAHTRLVAEKNKKTVIEHDIPSVWPDSSGTVSYKSVKQTKLKKTVDAKKQEEQEPYYKKITLDDGVRISPEPIKPFVLDETALRLIGANQKSKPKTTVRLKKEYRSQEYKRTAFKLIDSFFEIPGEQIFRLSGDTRSGRLTVQMCPMERVRNEEGLIDEQTLERELAQHEGIDEMAVRKQRLEVLKRKAEKPVKKYQPTRGLFK